MCLWNIPKNHVLCVSVAARNFQDLLLSWNGEMGSVRMKWILSFEGPLPKDFYPKGDLFLIIDNQSTTIFQMKNPITYHFQNVFCFFELTEGKGRSHLPRRDFKSHGCNGNESSMLYRVLCWLSSPQLRGGGPLRPPRGRRRFCEKGVIRTCGPRRSPIWVFPKIGKRPQIIHF